MRDNSEGRTDSVSPTPEDRTPSPATHSLTLDRGLRALWVLLEHPDGMSVSDLAAALGTHRAAVYRMLSPLLEHHLIRRRSDGRYLLAAGLIELASGVNPSLQEEARISLQELADELRATTALTMRDEQEGVVGIVVVPRSQILHLSYRTGMRHPLAVSAPGHALAAALPPGPRDTEDILRARAQGWSVSTGQLLPGATGVAAAVLTPAGDPVAAVSAVWISGIEIETAAAAVVRSAAELTAFLAHGDRLVGHVGSAA
jgi:DNA-binding IclR family transcriptional regulator